MGEKIKLNYTGSCKSDYILLFLSLPHIMVVQHTAVQTSISIWSISCLVAGIANFINATMIVDRIQYGRMVRVGIPNVK